jgi:hypothetical protein
MADLPGREQFEGRIARALGRVFREHQSKVLAALGDNPAPTDVAPGLLEAFRADLQGALQPILEAIFVAQAQGLTEHAPRTVAKQGGIGIDFALINERAATWAEQYAFELVNGVTGTTERALQRQIGQFFTDQRTLGDLQASIGRLFGPSRATQIAITETTRAASEGEQAFGRELEQLGLTVTHTWETNDDDRVCPICGPRDGKRRGDGWTEFPPAHVGCRCWTNTVVLRGG